MKSCLFVVCCLGLLALGSSLQAEDAAPAADKPVSYFRDVRPILQAQCQGCHQPARRGGEYVMTDFAGLLKGGESEEAAIVPGDPAKSSLIGQITPVDGKAEMPKEKPPLTADQIALITRWITEGAKDDTPESTRPHYDAEHPPTYHLAPIITSLDFSPDGQLLAVSGYHEVLLHKADGSGLVARLVGLSERIESAVFSPDGKKLAVAGGSPGRLGEIQIWDVEKRELLHSVPVTFDTVYGTAWSPDGKFISFGCGDNTVRAIDAETGAQKMYMGSHSDWALDTVFSGDGKSVISVSRDMTVKMTDLETQRFIGNITTHTPGVLRGGMICVDRHPKRNEVAVSGADGAPKLFKMETAAAPASGGNPNQIRDYPAMPGRVFDLCFAPDGNRFVAGSSLNGSGHLWIYETESGKKLLEFEGARGGIFAVAYRPDGAVIASGGFDGKVQLHDANTGKFISEFVPVEVMNQ